MQKLYLTSTISMSLSFMFTLVKRPRIALAGAMPIMVGSQPTTFQPTKRAIGFSRCFLTASSVAITTAAAPSLTPEALPAVTMPSFLKTGFNLANISAVV
ncbi:hypothetical protein M513_10369 [Trichuris suis]|uniref:Uncharacterized protein n=1 Tax=Trichuris suis TaxID=68888 RepID=A0A085LUU3_9BILA|nr:hypothetical protein M513_10369 [Trichuris suis]